MWIRQTRWIVWKNREHPFYGVCCVGVWLLALGIAADAGVGPAILFFVLSAMVLGVLGIAK